MNLQHWIERARIARNSRYKTLYSRYVQPQTSPLASQSAFQKVRGLLGIALVCAALWGIYQLRPAPIGVESEAVSTPVLESRTAPEDIVEAFSMPSSWHSGSFPVENFVAYTSPFGYRQHPFGGRRFHYGLDIAAPMGSYVRAWWDGKVVDISDDTACGTSVIIQSEDWVHIYCHLQGYAVTESDGDRWLVDSSADLKIQKGELVKGGKRIGRVGMTGRTTGPHLHWGLKYQGSWIDPASVLKAMAQPPEPY